MKIIDTLKSLNFVIPARARIWLLKKAEFPAKTRIRVLLPSVLLIAALVLSCPAQAAKNILIFGDSLSAGYGIERDTAWPNLLQQELRNSHPQFEVVNASISGETTAGGLLRISKVLQQYQPEIVIIELGANDGLRGNSLSEMSINLSRIIGQSQRANAKILLVGMRLPPNYGKEYVTGFQNAFVQLAKKYHIALLPFLLDGISTEQFQADNLHPQADAQPRIKENVMRSLRSLLPR